MLCSSWCEVLSPPPLDMKDPNSCFSPLQYLRYLSPHSYGCPRFKNCSFCLSAYSWVPDSSSEAPRFEYFSAWTSSVAPQLREKLPASDCRQQSIDYWYCKCSQAEAICRPCDCLYNSMEYLLTSVFPYRMTSFIKCDLLKLPSAF